MSEDQETMTKVEAAETLRSVDLTKRNAINSYRIPLLLLILSSLSYAVLILSYGMTEHENLWGLGLYIGGAGFVVFMSLYFYIFRILGVKLRIFPTTTATLKFDLLQLVVFAILFFGGRELRLLGLGFAPHLAALIGGSYLGYLLYKHPSGEYLAKTESYG